ncbi:MAG: ACT domain-containing protein [Deltaproteobacteria bacterium]|nr:ACT domain-containing protein [Deltaproteobacteria bacterium]
MATNPITRIETLQVDLDDQPGALAKVFGALREMGVNVHSSWGFVTHPGKGRVILYPSDSKKAREALSKLGSTVDTVPACLVKSEDKLGAYAELLGKITKAGVNLHATDAMAINGTMVAVFFARDQEWPKLCKALGC